MFMKKIVSDQYQRSRYRTIGARLESTDTSEESEDENTRQYEQESSDPQHIM